MRFALSLKESRQRRIFQIAEVVSRGLATTQLSKEARKPPATEFRELLGSDFDHKQTLSS